MLQTLTLSVVSHGHGPLLARLLDDLAGVPGIAQAGVIVTLHLATEAFDAGPWPGLAWPGLAITVIRNAVPKGFGANHNAAFARCRTDWFVVLNPDLRLAGVVAALNVLSLQRRRRSVPQSSARTLGSPATG